MAKIESFEDLECWKSAKELNILIYKNCETDKFRSEYAAKD